MDIEKKYELIPSDKEGLFRIKALKCFGGVMIGEIGGYVEYKNNLSQYGDCWIHCDAVVRDNARVEDNAMVWGKAVIQDNAIVRGDAGIFDNAIVRGNVVVRDNAEVCDNAVIQDNAIVRGDARIFDNAIVRGNVVVSGEADIRGNAIISSNKDYIAFKNWWSSGRYFTWTRSNNKWKVGCFYGTGEQLIAKAYEDSEESGREYERIVKYVEEVNNPYTQTLEKTWKYKIYLKLLSLKMMIVKLLR